MIVLTNELAAKAMDERRLEMVEWIHRWCLHWFLVSYKDPNLKPGVEDITLDCWIQAAGGWQTLEKNTIIQQQVNHLSLPCRFYVEKYLDTFYPPKKPNKIEEDSAPEVAPGDRGDEEHLNTGFKRYDTGNNGAEEHIITEDAKKNLEEGNENGTDVSNKHESEGNEEGENNKTDESDRPQAEGSTEPTDAQR